MSKFKQFVFWLKYRASIGSLYWIWWGWPSWDFHVHRNLEGKVSALAIGPITFLWERRSTRMAREGWNN